MTGPLDGYTDVAELLMAIEPLKLPRPGVAIGARWVAELLMAIEPLKPRAVD